MLPGRSNEINQLNKYYELGESSLLVLYGQKYSGISYILDEFAGDKLRFVYYAKQCSERQQRYFWGRELDNQGISVNEQFPDFSFIFEKIIDTSPDRKIVLVINDFHLIVKSDPEFFGQLSAFIRAYKNDNRIMCILVSDHIGYIENTFVEKIGRNAFAITGFMKIKPLHFLELVCNYDTSDTLKCMDFYCILGGLPELWPYFDINVSLKENIVRTFLSKDGPFRHIGTDILVNELRETSVYSTILSTIAEGKEKLNDIFTHTAFSRAKISVYIKNLMNLELIDKVYSYDTAGFENTKKGVYRIVSPLLDFWYKYVFPNEGELLNSNPEEFYDKYIADTITVCIGKYFSNVCREYVDILNEKELLPFKYTKKGEWVGKNGVINIVAQNVSRDTLLGFCNFETPVTTYEDYEWYLFTAKEARLRPDYIFLFSRGGFDERLTALAKEDGKIKLIDMREF